MGFMEEVQAESRPQGSSCKMCRLLEGMDKNDRADIETVLADKSYATSPIVRAMNKRGIDIGLSAVQRHRSNCVSA